MVVLCSLRGYSHYVSKYLVQIKIDSMSGKKSVKNKEINNIRQKGKNIII